MSKLEDLIAELCPDGVEYKELMYIVNNIFSGNNKSRNDRGKYPVYGSTGIIAHTDHFVYDTPLILIARVGAYAGQVNIANGQYDVSDNTLILNINSKRISIQISLITNPLFL